MNWKELLISGLIGLLLGVVSAIAALVILHERMKFPTTWVDIALVAYITSVAFLIVWL